MRHRTVGFPTAGRAAVAGVLTGALYLGTLLLPHSALAQQTADQARSVAQERDEIRRKLKELRANIAKTNDDKNQAAKALATVEKSIDDSNEQLRKLQAQRDAIALELRRIGIEETRIDQSIRKHQQQLARVLRAQYRRQQFNPIHTWLSGQSVNEVAREGYWFEKISRAEVDISDSLKEDLDELEVLRGKKEAQEDMLEDNSRAQEKKKRELMAQQEERRQLLAQLSSKLSAQRKEATVLEKDERRLSNLVEELARALRNAKRSNEATRPKRGGGGSVSDGVMAAIPDTGDFARLRGAMQLPVAGEIIGRFGQTRAADGTGPTWKGIFIRSNAGTPVRAVAAGRVVFAEWLRGFGQLVIVDHGDQYLSIYGNNQKLNKEVGDLVKPGEAIATTGNSGGNTETGLYFELRHSGQPFDPLKWAANR